MAMDQCLTAVYGNQEGSGKRGADLSSSAPKVTRWLGDIRQYFPTSMVQVMQKDAIERLGLQQLLLEPEVLETVEKDLNLLTTLISLKDMIPSKTKDTARLVVAQIVEDLIKRLQQPMQQAIKGALNKSIRNNCPRLKEIDWNRTIKANIKNYLPEYNTIVPEKLIGYGHKRSQAKLKDVILCVDQSGSMSESVVYSGIFAAVMASIPALATKLVVFDTAVVDFTEELHNDPVDLLFGLQLGGGTDINSAIGYCQGLITKPNDTVLILISDLYEGGENARLIKRMAELVGSGVQIIALLALSDEGMPYYDHDNASKFAALNIPSFACTPDQFPDLMAAALLKQDINLWAAKENIVVSH